jgi:hypothetical protein
MADTTTVKLESTVHIGTISVNWKAGMVWIDWEGGANPTQYTNRSDIGDFELAAVDSIDLDELTPNSTEWHNWRAAMAAQAGFEIGRVVANAEKGAIV